MIRRVGPRSLLVRTSLTMAVSVSMIALIAVLAVNVFVIRPMARANADDEAALLVLSAQTWVELPPESRPYFELELVENHGLVLSATQRDLPDYRGSFQRSWDYLPLLAEQLSRRLGQPVRLRVGDELVWADVPMGGFDMQIGFPEERTNIQPLYVAIIILVSGVTVVMVASLLIVQRLTRPLVRAARTAARFRGGGEFRPLPETGPSEIVTLASSFNTMAREITELLANRTTLLAGISHDLRTPLARMRVAVELLPESVPEELRRRFERNLEAMDDLIRTSLEFARGLADRPSEPVALRQLAAELVEQHPEVSVDALAPEAESLVLRCDRRALQRVLQNAINNAVQYGRGGAVRLGWSLARALESDGAEGYRQGSDGAVVVFRVDDEGPGIPPEAREKVLQPFFRLESSRNTRTGGSGLGLAIVDQLCQSHGWRLAIGESPAGGCRFEVSVPVAPVEDVQSRVNGAPPRIGTGSDGDARSRLSSRAGRRGRRSAGTEC